VWGLQDKERKSELTPFCVKAEHSTYLTAPRSLASRSPASELTGFCLWRSSFALTSGSSRKSTWVPTIKHGTPGQWWWTLRRYFPLLAFLTRERCTTQAKAKTHLWEPLLLDVLKASGASDAKADEENVGLGVRKRAEAVVILLTGRIKEAERVGVIADHDRDGIVVENGRDIFGRKLVGRVSRNTVNIRGRERGGKRPEAIAGQIQQGEWNALRDKEAGL
jgi:hypothetical protein